VGRVGGADVGVGRVEGGSGMGGGCTWAYAGGGIGPKAALTRKVYEPLGEGAVGVCEDGGAGGAGSGLGEGLSWAIVVDSEGAVVGTRVGVGARGNMGWYMGDWLVGEGFGSGMVVVSAEVTVVRRGV
jgi:hypothetical protein